MTPESAHTTPIEEQQYTNDNDIKEPTPAPTPDTQSDANTAVAQPENPVDVVQPTSTAQPAAPYITRPHLRFSPVQWVTGGIVRLLYRGWTRVAVRLFPENSKQEEFAQKLHLPLPDKLNMSWVNSHLAVGGRIRPEDMRALGLTGITHVIDTRSEYKDDEQALAQENIALLYLPTPDTYPLSVEQLMQGSQWAAEHIKQGGRVLIHCEHGVGRSVLLTCAVLVYNGMHARDALELVKQKRWQASPNHRQVARLKEFEAALATHV